MTNLTRSYPRTLPSVSQQDGYTALIFGAQNGHAPVVEMLLAAGADKDLQANVRIPQLRPLCQPATHVDNESCKTLPPSYRPPYLTNRTESRPS